MSKQQYITPEVLRVEHCNLMEGPVTVISGVVDNTNDARYFNSHNESTWQSADQTAAPHSVATPWE